MEQKFDIHRVIEYYKLDSDEIAKLLYPNAKYPKLAFDRILKGEAVLDVVQVEKLASHIGVLVADLFSSASWKSITEDNCLTFLKGSYKIKLNYNGAFVSIYKYNKLIGQPILNTIALSVHEFIDYLDNFIKNYENGNN